MNSTLATGLALAIAASILGMMVWSVQRIIARIDRLGDKVDALGTRVTIIETKQDTSAQRATRADKVGRATASKVGAEVEDPKK